jgi:hypothetical protein
MRADDTDVVVDAGVARASIPAVLARAEAEDLITSCPIACRHARSLVIDLARETATLSSRSVIVVVMCLPAPLLYRAG